MSKVYYYTSTYICNGYICTFVWCNGFKPAEYGWSDSKWGGRILKTPASEEAYNSFMRTYDWSYRCAPMRSVNETVTYANPLTGKTSTVEVKKFIPNRHQRKHGIRFIEM